MPDKQAAPHLARVTAPHFVAGLEVSANGYVLACADILKYMRGWPFYKVKEYVKRKKWGIELL